MDLIKSRIEDVFPKRSRIAIILGNGPSLTDPSVNYALEFQKILAEKNPVVFGVNRIFKDDYTLYRPVHYYYAVDRTCWRQYDSEITKLKPLRCFIYHRYLNNVENIPRMVSFDLNSDPNYISNVRLDKLGHNYTSMAGATQLALMQGAEEIYFFGIDCAPDKDGKTHAHGNERRKEKQWKNITNGTINILKKLRSLDITYIVYSNIFSFDNLKTFTAKQKASTG